MDPNVGTKQIDFPITEVLSKLTKQVAQTQEATMQVYHALKDRTNWGHKPLETHTLATIAVDPATDKSPDAIRARVLNWIFKNAFEECIMGVNEALIEAHRFAKLRSLANRSEKAPFKDEEVMERELASIHEAPTTMHLPDLITKIETELQRPLELRDEVLSINKVRNCLVHRGGLVSAADLKGTTNRGLRLSYIDLITYVEKEGELLQLSRELKQQVFATKEIRFIGEPREVLFQTGEQITIDQDVFNGVSSTCLTFGKELLRYLLPYAPSMSAEQLQAIETMLTTTVELRGKLTPRS